MKKLDFNIPFSPFCWVDFLNSFAAVHVYLSDIPHNEDYDCAEKTTGDCTDCGNCRDSIGKIQNNYYFFFGTVTGCASFLEDYDGIRKNPKDGNIGEVIDFCMKYAGYDYKVTADNLLDEVKLAVDGGIPVLAKLKDTSKGPFRILIGYDKEELLMPEYTGAQCIPERAPTVDEIESLYIITGKTVPSYTLVDGLRKIEESLEDAMEKGIWTNAIPQFDYWNRLKKLPIEEIKARFERVKNAAWNFDRCHNFKSAMACIISHPTFRESMQTLKLPEDKQRRCAELGERIEKAYHSSHELQWALISLHDCRHFAKKEMDPVEAGMCECARIIIKQLIQNDHDVLNAIRGLIEIIT